MNRNLIIIFLSLLFALALVSYWTGSEGGTGEIIRNVLYVSTSFVGVVAGVTYLSVAGLKGSRSRTVLLLTLGMGSWFVGEALWNYLEIIYSVSPFPSIADVFFLLAYPLIFFAFLNEIKTATVSFHKLQLPILFLLGLTTILLVFLVGYFGVYLAYDPASSMLANMIAIGYGIGDLFLIVITLFVLILAWEFRGGQISRVWIALFISFSLILAADILFALNTQHYQDQLFSYKLITDSMWMAAYVIFAFALFDLAIVIQNAHKAVLDLPKKTV